MVIDQSLIEPARRALAVTPNNDADMAGISRAIYVGGAGNLELVTRGGDTVVLVGVPAGSLLPIQARRIRAASTTATNIVILY